MIEALVAPCRAFGIALVRRYCCNADIYYPAGWGFQRNKPDISRPNVPMVTSHGNWGSGKTKGSFLDRVPITYLES